MDSQTTLPLTQMDKMGHEQNVFCQDPYTGLKAAYKTAYGNDSVVGKRVLVQGSGNIGGYLVDHVIEDGAKVMIADIFEDKIQKVLKKHSNVEVVANDISSIDVDIYAPCAPGATLNNETIPDLNRQIVAGAANNQRAKEDVHGKMLLERGIIYAPDFLIESYSELGGYNRDRAFQSAEGIYTTTEQVLNKSRETAKPFYQIANEMAE